MNSKLIRDKIPEILESKEIKCKIRIMDEPEFQLKLNEKLQEEVTEYFAAETPKDKVLELVDISEVIYTIAELHGYSKEEFENLKVEKHDKNGGFKNKILLIELGEDI